MLHPQEAVRFLRHGRRSRLGALALSMLGAAGVGAPLVGCGEPASLGGVSGGTGGDGSGGSATGGIIGTGGIGTGGADHIGEMAGMGPAGTGGYYQPPAQARVAGKVDLLLVIDNSISMADKQELLRESVPAMVRHLVNPPCLEPSGQVVSQPDEPSQACPAGSARDFSAVTDLHVGVVSSSLGGHGGIACSPAAGTSWSGDDDDRGELIAPLRGVEGVDGLGYFAWDPSADLEAFIGSLTAVVAAAGEGGCGYEAPLEAMYRFLIDPEPPTEVVQQDFQSARQGVNATLLAQRAAFLRPDSAVTVVLLSDENDCSIADEGPGYYVAGASASVRLPRGTSACATDPDSPCCRSCALPEVSPPSGCAELSADQECMAPPYTDTEEHANLRCWDQRRRFGIDFLYPTSRYVRGLTEATIRRDRDGAVVANPLFAGGRDPSLVTLVGIVGVPWQLLARSQNEAVPLRFKPAMQLHSEDLWPAIVGEPAAYVSPLDPFMVESLSPRTELPASPVTGLQPADITSPAGTSPVNGHEFEVMDGGDLQYACTFPLTTPRECLDGDVGGCDCKSADPNLATKPLCQASGTSTAGNTQFSAKAYPGLRELEVLRRLGPLGVPASICPRETADPSDPSYGYLPVVQAVFDRMRDVLE